MTNRIDVATSDDVADIIASADALVATDAGRYDAAGTDLGGRRGPGTALLATDDNPELLARDGDDVLGHLVGRLSGPGSGVRPIRVAELDSIHVYPAHQDCGIGERLADRSRRGRRTRARIGCLSPRTPPTKAQRFYVRCGFAPRFVTLDRALLGAENS